MARITMRNSQKATFAEVFEIYISAVTARGVKDKTIAGSCVPLESAPWQRGPP